MTFFTSSTFGIPNGQAYVQFLQPIHFSIEADKTVPSAAIEIACTGHDSAQAGVTQCIHGVGEVATVSPGFSSSTNILDK
jgi:hypothetical protein